MNNNLNFSKNMFGGQTETKIAGNAILPNNSDGGRRSLDDVREMQANANRGIRPDMNNLNQTRNELPPRPNDTQMNMRSKMEAMRSMNNNFRG